MCHNTNCKTKEKLFTTRPFYLNLDNINKVNR